MHEPPIDDPDKIWPDRRNQNDQDELGEKIPPNSENGEIPQEVRSCHDAWLAQFHEGIDPESGVACSNCFAAQAVIAQEMKRVMYTRPTWDLLRAPQRECLEIVIHRIAAILNGGSRVPEHWHTIAGYASAVERWLQVAPENCPACDNKTGPGDRRD